MEPITVNDWYEYLKEHPTFTGCLIDRDNDIAWYQNGEEHREDGPAIEGFEGYKEWWLNGVRYYREEDYKIALRKLKLERILKIQEN